MSRRCVFLDRDGVINEKQPDGCYVTCWDEFRWIPETIDWIRLFNALDYLVIVVTNQRGVSREIMTQAAVDSIHQQMVAELASMHAIINDVFVCPHELDSCDCRKPKPGMVKQACEKWDIDLLQSLMIGDSKSDQQMAECCGLQFIGSKNGKIVDLVTD